SQARFNLSQGLLHRLPGQVFLTDVRSEQFFAEAVFEVGVVLLYQMPGHWPVQQLGTKTRFGLDDSLNQAAEIRPNLAELEIGAARSDFVKPVQSQQQTHGYHAWSNSFGQRQQDYRANFFEAKEIMFFGLDYLPGQSLPALGSRIHNTHRPGFK